MRDVKELLTEDNYLAKVYRFQDRQAGVSVIFDPKKACYTYNAYCLEVKIMKELFSVEYDFLEDALHTINEEFGNWDLVAFGEEKSGCSTCVAKK